jgi:hypothetical protein
MPNSKEVGDTVRAGAEEMNLAVVVRLSAHPLYGAFARLDPGV